ncbi:MAG: UvrD-helicase domain-containing protein [Acidimicrobiales bacterium]
MSRPTALRSPDEFDLCGPLPSSLTVLEASAGTGKTFTIAGLAARYIAEGATTLERMLVVTFTRMATGELRERVRERLVAVEAGLRLAMEGVPPAGGDTVLDLLAAGTPEAVEQRRGRLAAALSSFDAATITTTHGFCRHVLSELGTAGDVGHDVTFVEDATDLVREVVDDLYIRHVLRNEVPGFGEKEAREIVARAIADPTAPIEPSGARAGSTWAKRRALAMAARQHVERRKLRSRSLTYEDLLTRLKATLADPERGMAAARRLRERYQVVLVDEFQDTDPVQWDILRTAFGDGDGDGGGGRDGGGRGWDGGRRDGGPATTMVLIGDPKQAIYSFRGADVLAYLDAAHAGNSTIATLSTNWRSDQGLLDACESLFGNCRLGHPEIVHRSVTATSTHVLPGLSGAPIAAPLRIRAVSRDAAGIDRTNKGYVSKRSGEAYVARDLAADLVGLLNSGASVVTRDGTGAELEPRELLAGHVAVLVRTNHQASVVRSALDATGVPAVINGADSVFGAPAANDWLRLVEALERPGSRSRANAVALTPFVGWTAQELARAPEDDLDMLQADLAQWSGVLDKRGVASLLDLVSRSRGLQARLLAGAGGERRLTDLRHVGQLLHAQATSEGLGTTALAAWLRQRITEADGGSSTEERSRRLESDADAVQVLTIHRSKGLEFPIVYAPYLWASTSIDPEIFVYHDRGQAGPAGTSGGSRTIDVGGNGGPGHEVHKKWRKQEERGEDLRLAYVALTRACHQAVLWWAPSYDSRLSPLGRLLFGRRGDGEIVDELTSVPTDDEARTALEALSLSTAGTDQVHTISVESAVVTGAARFRQAAGTLRALSVSRFDRCIDNEWSRTSYSRVTSAVRSVLAGGTGSEPAGGELVASEPEATELSDEEGASYDSGPRVSGSPVSGSPVSGSRDPGSDVSGSEAALRSVPSLWDAIPGGTLTGTFVHSVLEAADFGSGDLEAELSERSREQVARRGSHLGDTGLAVRGILAALQTPLGPLAGDISLSQVANSDRLHELVFELPLAGGDRCDSGEGRARTANPGGGAAGGGAAGGGAAGGGAAGGGARLSDIAGLLRRHLANDDPLAGYVETLADLWPDQALRGYLTGSIDLVVRFRGAPERFMVIDYKTDRLGGIGEPLSAWHYRPSALAEVMSHGHYPLQALLYSVALHRYLRWRLPGYRPERNLAGVLYLFVRGMTGAANPRVDDQPCGVFSWRPPATLVTALSDLLDAGRLPR